MIAEAAADGRRERDPLRRLERLSALEAPTLCLLLGVAAPLKHLAHQPLGVAVLGPVHGLVFLAYLWTVLQTAAEGDWRPSEVARLLVVPLVPTGGYAHHAVVRRRATEARRATPA